MPEKCGSEELNCDRVSVKRKPEWLKCDLKGGADFRAVEKIVDENALHTICSSGKCPNKTECWSRRTATFMVLGEVCTRSCRFCATHSGKPLPVDDGEPSRVARSVVSMGLRHVVLTSVDRDDLPDGGAAHWARVIRAVRANSQESGVKSQESATRHSCTPENSARVSSLSTFHSPLSTIEVLIPDFDGREELLDIIVAARPDIIGHNLETVRRLTPTVRSRAKYETSLAVLKYISSQESRVKSQESANAAQKGLLTPDSLLLTKSGLMLGLGETQGEVLEAMDDLREAGVSILTLGQYLQPSREHLPVAEYVTLEMFDFYRAEGLRRGFSYVASGPLVRSSYMADLALEAVL